MSQVRTQNERSNVRSMTHTKARTLFCGFETVGNQSKGRKLCTGRGWERKVIQARCVAGMEAGKGKKKWGGFQGDFVNRGESQNRA